MFETEMKVKLLIDILAMKQKALSQVLSITENQESVLLSGETGNEIHAFFNGMSQEKQHFIDEVLKADAIFQRTFDEISDGFEKFAEVHGELTGQLQNCVKAVMDLDIKIRVLERRNRGLISKHNRGHKIPLLKASKSRILSQYKKYNGKTDS